MSSNDSNNKRNPDSNKDVLRSIGKTFAYYFDIFYGVVKGLVGILIVLFIIIGALAGGTVIGYFASLVEETPMPTYAEMSEQVNNYNSKSTLYYADNSVINDLRSDLIRTPVPLEQISPLIINAVIATEDENFTEHEGIVPKALIRAGIQEVMNAPLVTGGSTITQQLIKQQILSPEVTHSRKAIEILYATHLENSFEKDEILEAYLNVSPFGRNNLGQNIAGIEEAARGIFGVPAAEVTLPQASFLAGLPKSPISFSPYTQNGLIKEDLTEGLTRQGEVLYSMFREGYITEEAYQAALNYDVTQDFIVSSEDDMERYSRSYVYDLIEEEARNLFIMYFMREDGLSEERIKEIMISSELLKQTKFLTPENTTLYQANVSVKNEYLELADSEMRNGGYDIYSTIDPVVHNAIEQRVLELQDSLGAPQVVTFTTEDGETGETVYPVQLGGTFIENETGRVLGFVGGRDYELSNYNRAFDMRRQNGSTIKPLITYGPALAENVITPATMIHDSAVIIKEPGQEDHEIGNASGIRGEFGSARRWLAISQNTPNTKVFLEMRDNGVDYAKYIRAMGIGPEAIPDEELYYPSTSIGGNTYGMSPTEMSGAYAMIGNKGVYNEPYVIERIVDSSGEVIYQHEPNPVRVWPEDANYLLYDMLRDVTGENGTTPYLHDALNFNVDLASKTGTTDETRDVWYAGTTPKVTFATWMGYDGNELSLLGDYPTDRNVRIWADIMNTVYSVKPEIMGAGEIFEEPDGVVEESVLAATGMKPGNVELPNNRTVRVSGDTKTEIFRRENVPKTTEYDFSIGAKPEELRGFWSRYADSQRSNRRNNRRNNNDDEDNDNDDSDNDDNDNDDNDNDESSSDEEDNE